MKIANDVALIKLPKKVTYNGNFYRGLGWRFGIQQNDNQYYTMSKLNWRVNKPRHFIQLVLFR
jgi:hypothetical protein